MAGLVPAIHVFLAVTKTWMPGTRPDMTGLSSDSRYHRTSPANDRSRSDSRSCAPYAAIMQRPLQLSRFFMTLCLFY
jgi:hypothetical protein